MIFLSDLSDEQQDMANKALQGKDVIVDATVGSGKTTAIQALCTSITLEMKSALYLTYSRLLRAEAKQKISGMAEIHSFHSFVYHFGHLQEKSKTNLSNTIHLYNLNFDTFKKHIPPFDYLIVDEYQDLNESYALLIENIRSTNPDMTVVLVGDPEQKIHDSSSFDVVSWTQQFLPEAEHVNFSQSFRMGPEMAKKLSIGWNKPIIGANEDQQILHVSEKEAINMMGEMEPREILAIGMKSGGTSRTLNAIEAKWPDKFNKHTVYASIKNNDDRAKSEAGDGAVFCAYDSAKGMEKHTVFVFDFDTWYWELRNSFADTNPEIMRNLFLVAASRGKERIVFVHDEQNTKRPEIKDDHIHSLPLHKLTDLEDLTDNNYEHHLITAPELFEHKHNEDVLRLMDNLNIEEEDHGGEKISIKRYDGKMDLGPAILEYILAKYFDDNRLEKRNLYMDMTKNEVAKKSSEKIREISQKIQKGLKQDNFQLWVQALEYQAHVTNMTRFLVQVDTERPPIGIAPYIQRLEEHYGSRDNSTARYICRLNITGTGEDQKVRLLLESDATVGGQEYRTCMKTAEELSSYNYLEAGIISCFNESGKVKILTLNDNKVTTVSVKDREKFLNDTVRCLTKGRYDTCVNSASQASFF